MVTADAASYDKVKASSSLSGLGWVLIAEQNTGGVQGVLGICRAPFKQACKLSVNTFFLRDRFSLFLAVYLAIVSDRCCCGNKLLVSTATCIHIL